MKKLLLGAALAASMLAAAPAANAAQYINVTGPGVAGTYSAAFGFDGVTNGNFEHTFDFDLLLDGVGSGTVTSTLTLGVPATDINFTSVTLNGHEFNVGLTGDNEFRFLNNLAITSGPQKLVVKGWSGGNGSYGGQMTFAPVPEPATWAMMIIGFGAAGTMVRARRKLVPTVA